MRKKVHLKSFTRKRSVQLRIVRSILEDQKVTNSIETDTLISLQLSATLWTFRMCKNSQFWCWLKKGDLSIESNLLQLNEWLDCLYAFIKILIIKFCLSFFRFISTHMVGSKCFLNSADYSIVISYFSWFYQVMIYVFAPVIF